MTEPTLSELLAPIYEIGWEVNSIFFPFTINHMERTAFTIQIWSKDRSRFANGDGPALSIAVARAVVSAKDRPLTRRPDLSQLSLEDLDL